MTLTAKRLRALKSNVSQNHIAHKTQKISVLFVLNQPHRLWKDTIRISHNTRRSGRAKISTHIYSNRFTVKGIHYYYRYLIKFPHLIQTSSVSSNYFKVARQMARRLTGIQVVEAEQPPSSCSKDADADRRHKNHQGKQRASLHNVPIFLMPVL